MKGIKHERTLSQGVILYLTCAGTTYIETTERLGGAKAVSQL